ncbi:MAG: VOC family protein [Sandaracinaceae bacterium]
MIRSFKSVVLASKDPDRLAAFYRDALGLPIEPELHRGTERHWAGMVGAQHFAIHPLEGFWLPTDAQRSFVSFDVDSVPAALDALAPHGVEVVARTRIGPMAFVALRDPDGAVVCLGERWPDTTR